jgi:hypothetical protein
MSNLHGVSSANEMSRVSRRMVKSFEKWQARPTEVNFPDDLERYGGWRPEQGEVPSL